MEWGRELSRIIAGSLPYLTQRLQAFVFSAKSHPLTLKSKNMNQEQFERFQKLTLFLEALPEERFNFGKVVTVFNGTCGSVCCAIGWTPSLFPDIVHWEIVYGDAEVLLNDVDGFQGYIEVAMRLFGINYIHADGLFTPESQRLIQLNKLSRNASAFEVAQIMRRYIAKFHPHFSYDK